MSTDTGTSAPVANRDNALNEIINATGPGVADDVSQAAGEVRVTVTLDGPAEPERYRELQQAVDRHCPVLDLFRNPRPIVTELAVA